MYTSFATALLASTLLAADFMGASATDYAGGWLATDPTAQCVDICSAPSATCLTKDPTCLAKEKVPGDFDYLVLEQLFVPQFCRDLLQGVDSTISHQNINKYPNGTACYPEVVKSELTIHGLWPNYNDGYVSCCNPSANVTNDPYNAEEFALTEPALLAEMGEKWVDATQNSTYDTLCEIYNHEFQKHGLCYAADGADYISAAVTYFTAALNTADRLSAASAKIAEWAAQDVPQTTLAEIKALYDYDVLVLCSAADSTYGTNQLSVIRTCYEKPANITSDGPTTQINCPSVSATSTFSICTADAPITLNAYVAPISTPAPTTATPAPTTATPVPTTATPVPTTATPAPTTATPVPTTATPKPTTKAPTPAPTPRTQPFCRLFDDRFFCSLLSFCEWDSANKECDGRW